MKLIKGDDGMDSGAVKNGIFSLIIPGLGQYLNGEKKKGLGFLGVAILLHVFSWYFMNNSFGSIVQTLYHLYAGYDAYKNY